MKESISYKVKQLSKQAKSSGKSHPDVTLTSGNETSLSKVIKTKKDAELFMKMLKTV